MCEVTRKKPNMTWVSLSIFLESFLKKYVEKRSGLNISRGFLWGISRSRSVAPQISMTFFYVFHLRISFPLIGNTNMLIPFAYSRKNPFANIENGYTNKPFDRNMTFSNYTNMAPILDSCSSECDWSVLIKAYRVKSHVNSEMQNLSCRTSLTFSWLTWPLPDPSRSRITNSACRFNMAESPVCFYFYFVGHVNLGESKTKLSK